ncbi:MAG TPA: hypothetical protein VIH93_16895, partial [Thermoanaerobaculia bacterium]
RQVARRDGLGEALLGEPELDAGRLQLAGEAALVAARALEPRLQPRDLAADLDELPLARIALRRRGRRGDEEEREDRDAEGSATPNP